MIIVWILIPYSGGPTLREYGRLETMKGDWIPMKLRRFLSCMMALLLVCGLPLSALAEEYDLAKGSITVTANESGQYVTQEDQGILNEMQTSDTVITQSNSSETSTTNTVTIMAGEGAANVTIKDVNIVISDPSGAPPVDHSGEAAVTIDVAEGAEANVTLDGVNIDVGKTGDDRHKVPGEAAVQITGNGDVTIELDGENTVQSGLHRAGVEKNDGDSSGSLTITDENGTDGSLKATGGFGGSGIGGGKDGSGSNITITGSAEVTAQGNAGGAGIGGGDLGSGSDITITSGAEVTANGGQGGAGIGGGSRGSGNGITISGSAQVEATGGLYASGIGGGYKSIGNGTGSNITVSGDAQVKAQGGNYDYSNGSNTTQGAGAAIGNGGGYILGNHPEDVKGKDAEVTTEAPKDGESYGLYVGELKEGWVATYAPDEDMDTEKPGSLTYQGGIEAKDAEPVPRKEPTCTDPGHEAGFMIGDVLVAVTIPATGHNVPDGTPNGDATCVALGTMEGYCIDCQTTVTVTDPNSKLKEHTFTTYTPDPDNLATCTEAGTKTAVCDVCKTATHTIPDPAKNHSMGDFSTYKEATCTEAGEERAYCKNNCGHYETKDIPPQGHSFTKYSSDGNATYTEDGTKTAHCDHSGCAETHTLPDPGSRLPFYQVKGKDGGRLPCREEKQDGVLTITVEADFATLTGKLSGMHALKAQGIDTIVFVTSGVTSTFAVEDLLAQGAFGDSYRLTHDGSTVTFTLSNGTDIGKILK